MPYERAAKSDRRARGRASAPIVGGTRAVPPGQKPHRSFRPMTDLVSLKAISGPMTGETIRLADQETVVFGRSADCGKGTLSGDQTVGWQQFVVQVRRPQVRLWSLGKTNPTYVNAKPYGGKLRAGGAVAAGEPNGVRLRNGDRIQAGHGVFAVIFAWPDSDEDAPAPPAEAGTAGADEPAPTIDFPTPPPAPGAPGKTPPSAPSVPPAETPGPGTILPLPRPAARGAPARAGTLEIEPGDGPPLHPAR